VKLALKVSLIVGFIFVAFFSLFILALGLMLMLLREGLTLLSLGEVLTPPPSLGEVIVALLYSVSLFAALGAATGTIRAVVLLVIRFDPEKHLLRISNESDVAACRSGVLPFRQRIRLFWEGLAWMLAGVGIAALVFLDPPESPGEWVAVLFVIGFGLFILLRGVVSFVELLAPSLDMVGWVQGCVTKSIERGYRRSTKHYLRCGKDKLETDSRIWSAIRAGERYRLWYLGAGDTKRAIAYQKAPLAQLREVAAEHGGVEDARSQ
jgi:hypothetical protein